MSPGTMHHASELHDLNEEIFIEPETGPMLHDFISVNREEIIARCRAKVATLPANAA
ncbi:MAG: hypothetical protein ACRD3C_03215 [Vicinamibacterales bacterium]